MHAHDYPKSDAQVVEWVKTLDAAGLEKTLILTYSSGPRFDSAVARYAPYKSRFEIWCGFDYTGLDQLRPGDAGGLAAWTKRAVAELERCHKKGATGVGELGDKGLGELYSKPIPGYGLHIDDPRMKPLLEKCAELHMPVSIHVAEDEWMYLRQDSTNDGLMNSSHWTVDLTKKGILNHDQLVGSLENAVKMNPGTTFIACHLANCCSDLRMLGKLFDRYPNLYADIAARYGEVSPVPRYTKDFFEKYQDRIVYGTDMGTESHMYEVTFRILETADEHFYEKRLFNYHWPLYGLSLTDAALQKIYNGNARKILLRGH
jgi:predicted TIM-barrel fold metal-dependent hydrolase